ncbi:hypothetical protein HDU76_012918 [Blyttiomyces sp. JEL0837]|nr:hypothetical protein HDU76_012918 [Blyttiomyces sp. JEL0837]
MALELEKEKAELIRETIFKTRRIYDCPLIIRDHFYFTDRYWQSSANKKSSFNALFHEACYRQYHKLARFFVNSGFCDLSMNNGFAFQMIFANEYQMKQNRNLLETGQAVRRGMSAEVLVAAAHLPVNLFQKVVTAAFSYEDVKSYAGECLLSAVRNRSVDSVAMLLQLHNHMSSLYIKDALHLIMERDSFDHNHNMIYTLFSKIDALQSGLVLDFNVLINKSGSRHLNDLPPFVLHLTPLTITPPTSTSLQQHLPPSTMNISKLPAEILTEIAVNLHPHEVRRLALTDSKMFQLFSDPSYHFAKRNLQIHIAPIEKDENINLYLADIRDSFDLINMEKLGEQYYAASIGIRGVEDTGRDFEDKLDFCHDTFNPHDDDRCLHDASFRKYVHCLSIAMTAGDIDLEGDHGYYPLRTITVMGKLVTLQYLYSHHRLPSQHLVKLLNTAIDYDKIELADWLLSLNELDPSGNDNEAVISAMENDDLDMYLKLVSDKRVAAKIDANFHQYYCYASESTSICSELLTMDGIKPALLMMDVTILGAFELLFDDERFLHSLKEVSRQQLLCRAAMVGSLRVVKYLVNLGGVDVLDNECEVFYHALRGRNIELLEYFLSMDGIEPSMYDNRAFTYAVMSDFDDLVKFLIETNKLVDSNLNVQQRNEFNFKTARYWLQGHTISRTCFNILFHEACFRRRKVITRLLIDSGLCDLTLGDGFPLRMVLWDNIESWNISDVEEISKHLIQTGKVIRRGLSIDYLVLAAGLPLDLFKQVISAAFSTEDLLDCALKCLESAIHYKRLDNIDYIFMHHPEFTKPEVASALETAIIQNCEAAALTIIEKCEPKSIAYSLMETAVDGECSLDFIVTLWRHGSLESRRRLMDYAVAHQMFALARKLAGL